MNRQAHSQNLTLDVDAAARNLLVKEGYDLEFGVRPLKRAVEEQLLNPLAAELLEGNLSQAIKSR